MVKFNDSSTVTFRIWILDFRIRIWILPGVNVNTSNTSTSCSEPSRAAGMNTLPASSGSTVNAVVAAPPRPASTWLSNGWVLDGHPNRRPPHQGRILSPLMQLTRSTAACLCLPSVLLACTTNNQMTLAPRPIERSSTRTAAQ